LNLTANLLELPITVLPSLKVTVPAMLARQ